MGTRCSRHGSLQRFRNPTLASLHRVRAVCVSRLRRYYRGFRLPDALPTALRCPSLGSTDPCACFRFRPPDAGQRTGSFVVWQPLTPISFRIGDVRISQVPGKPFVPMPRSKTPAGPIHQAIVQCIDTAPESANTGGSCKSALSRLNDAALALAVYASSPPSLDGGRKTRFPLLANSTGRDSSPAGFE